MDTTLLAQKILASGELNKEGYSLRELFQIRDALNILYRYGLADTGLLIEVEKYIKQEAEKL